MMNHDPALEPPQPVEYGTLTSYFSGFLCSLLLTLFSYWIAVKPLLSGWQADAAIGGLAIVQAWIQLLLFFNLTREAKPRWNLIVFFFMLMVVVIVVGGSIWIMNNLNYNLMSP